MSQRGFVAAKKNAILLTNRNTNATKLHLSRSLPLLSQCGWALEGPPKTLRASDMVTSDCHETLLDWSDRIIPAGTIILENASPVQLVATRYVSLGINHHVFKTCIPPSIVES